MNIIELTERAKFLPSDENGNRVVVLSGSDLTTFPNSHQNRVGGGEGIKVSFTNSKNCTAIISNDCRFYGTSVIVFSNSESSTVFIDRSKHRVTKLSVFSKYANGSFCCIGQDFSCVSCSICFSDRADVSIGTDCMFSDNISIWNWDGHTILDQKGNCINRAENIVIEDHVWIGMNASVSKGAKISKNSVVGQKSLVTRVFEEENVILAGVPAKIIKREISWDRTPSSIWDKSNVK